MGSLDRRTEQLIREHNDRRSMRRFSERMDRYGSRRVFSFRELSDQLGDDATARDMANAITTELGKLGFDPDVADTLTPKQLLAVKQFFDRLSAESMDNDAMTGERMPADLPSTMWLN